MEEFLEHIGVKRRSGRYPWGSGEEPYQRSSSFLSRVEELRKQGLSEKEIADSFGYSKAQYIAKKSAERNAERKANEAYAYRLKEKNYSNTAIAEKMGRNESYVRTLLKPSEAQKADTVNKTRDFLKDQVDKHGVIDIGKGTELHINDGVSPEKLKAAVAGLKDEGYVTTKVFVPQLSGSGDNNTTTLVLAKPGTDTKDIWANPDKVHTIATPVGDLGDLKRMKVKPPVSVSSKRVTVKYDEDGGSNSDGLIEIRPTAKDLSLGASRYAQVRIAVDGTHYIKGMAVYSDDLPPGVDIRFNTNKKRGTPLTSKSGDAVLKKMTDDPKNPFETTIKPQLTYKDSSGKTKQSAINIVNAEGDWNGWSRSLASQFVSKQQPSFAKKQLKLAHDLKKEDFDEIMKLTNPAVRKKMLLSIADEMDADAVHLKAAALPRQNWKTILPLKTIKDNQVYAPGYKNGEKVVLVRYPHAGVFEIPELTVNNKNREGIKMMGKNPFDAIGISAKTAAKMSGADFDGDTVMVIPNNDKKIKTSPSLRGLRNFDPKEAYPAYPGMVPMKKEQKGQKMGDISNLITDMQIKKASQDEIAKAVRHSMVVIDAPKHKLNWKQSYEDNEIARLKEKYQRDGNSRGAATLISRANSPYTVPKRTPRSAREGGPIDPKTGKKVYTTVSDDKLYYKDKKGKLVKRYTQTTKMAEANDAHKLSSGTVMEGIYADYANRLKSMANQARKEALATPNQTYSPAARKAYLSEVAKLTADLNIAKKNAPLERKAQILANKRVRVLKENNPSMDKDHLKKLKARELGQARVDVGAKRHAIKINQKQWEAIQAGAISHTKLSEILLYADQDTVKKLAMPKTTRGLSAAKQSRAKSMITQGYTMGEVAELLGVSVSTIQSVVKGD